MLLTDIRSRFRKDLAGSYPMEEIDSIFHMLTEYFCGFPRTLLAMEPQREVADNATGVLMQALEELRDHRPVQYIIGKVDFMGMELKVTPEVLIPRPETEELIRWIMQDIPEPEKHPKILDIGTGSGCIALGLKKNLAGSEVHAMDVSPGALEVAKFNARQYQLDIRFHRADICNPEQRWPHFDLLVSNPPYIPAGEASGMATNVTASEPHLALFVPDEDPLKIYRCIGSFAERHLRKNGRTYLEIHESYGQEVCALLAELGFTDIVLKKDIFGKDRMIGARWTGSPK